MKICIEGKPIPKKRARHARRGNFITTYDPQSALKEDVRSQMTQIIIEAINSENKQISMEASNLAYAKAFYVNLSFYLPTIDSDSDGQKNAKLWGFELANKKPDCDNLAKFYLDCANGILWKDDSMIVQANAQKQYGYPARVEIEIMPKEPIKLHEKTEGVLKVFSPYELKELFKDAYYLSKQDNQNIFEMDRDNKEHWLSTTAHLLSEFANKYADKLKKVNKFDSVEKKVKKDDLQKDPYSVGKPLC